MFYVILQAEQKTITFRPGDQRTFSTSRDPDYCSGHVLCHFDKNKSLIETISYPFDVQISILDSKTNHCNIQQLYFCWPSREREREREREKERESTCIYLWLLHKQGNLSWNLSFNPLLLWNYLTSHTHNHQSDLWVNESITVIPSNKAPFWSYIIDQFSQKGWPYVLLSSASNGDSIIH